MQRSVSYSTNRGLANSKPRFGDPNHTVAPQRRIMIDQDSPLATFGRRIITLRQIVWREERYAAQKTAVSGANISSNGHINPGEPLINSEVLWIIVLIEIGTRKWLRKSVLPE